MSLCNVLITSAGRRVSLVRCFKQALQRLGVDGKIFAVDLQANAPALYVADEMGTVPRVTEPGYTDYLLNYCRRHDIRLVVPTIDTELHILSTVKGQFEQQGIHLLVCSDAVNQISFDKRTTQTFFEQNGVPAPIMYEIDEALSLSEEHYPLLLKPARGSCSVGVTKVNNRRELQFFLEYLDDPVIQECIEGDEFTVDVLVGTDSEVICIVPRLRVETRAGEVSKATTVKDPAVIDATRQVVEALDGAEGCVTVQCFKLRDGPLRFIEINPRFGGGFPLTAEAGADFPRWLLQMELGMALDQDPQGCWQDGRVMLRYDEGIYLDREQLES